MSKKPFFSIVIPTYNRAGFILDTLATVFDQTFQDFEVIVVDNCSTDNTKEVLAPYIASNKISFIAHDKNYERAKSRNTGMKHAQGEYLTFLDSDDFMYPDNLKDAYDFLQQEKYPVFHNLYETVDANKQRVYSFTFAKLTNPLVQLSKGNFLSCIGVFISKEVYTSVFWDENPLLTGSEDYDYWLRVVATFPKVGRIHKINNGILEHPARTVNTSQLVQTEKRFIYFFEKMDQDTVYIKGYGNLRNKIKASLYIYMAALAESLKDKESTVKYMKKAVSSDPSIVFRRGFLSLSFKLLKGINH